VEATVDVAAWLKNLGLWQYEAAFRDNAIDGDLLPSLTAEDLKDLGVTIVGHRRRLLDAIAALGAASKSTPAPADPPATLHEGAVSSRPPSRSGADAERRPITVMFCDLVGSTSLAAKLDAEDWRTLVNTDLDEASAAVTGLGGHVLKKLGDGLMALFGYPHAQENDAERAKPPTEVDVNRSLQGRDGGRCSWGKRPSHAADSTGCMIGRVAGN
jgi:hypothetical protein